MASDQFPKLVLGVFAAMFAGVALSSAHATLHHIHESAADPGGPAVRQDVGAPLSVALVPKRATAIALVTDVSSHACSFVSGQFAYLQHAVDPNREHLLTIVLDPAVGDDEALRRYADSLGDDASRWTIRRATESDRVLASRMGIRTTGDVSAHVQRVAIVNAGGLLVSIVESGAPDDVAGALAEVAPAASAEQHFTGRVVADPSPAPDFTLTDQHSRAFTLSHQRGNVVVMFFGYTHCPDVCPATMAQLAHVYRGLEPRLRAHTVVAFVTVDPDRDGPTDLGRFVGLFDPHFVGLTGAPRALDPVYRSYHVWHQKLPGSRASGYLVAHGGDVYLIDEAGRLRVRHGWQDDAAAIGNDIRELLS